MATRNTARRWPMVLLAFVIVLALIVVGAWQLQGQYGIPYFGGNTEKIQGKVIGSDDSGAKITATSQAAPRDLQAEPAKVPARLLPPMSPFDGSKPHKWHITSIEPSGKLKAPLQLTLPLDHPVRKGEFVHIAVNHSHTADGWDLADLNKVQQPKVGDKSVTFTVNKLSWFAPFFSDIGNMVSELKTQFIDGMTSNVFANAKQPECANEDAAREENHQFNSSGKDAILWCAGKEKIKGQWQRVIKMTNNRTAPEIIDPSWLKIHSRGKADLNLSQILNQGDKVVLNGTDTAVFYFGELKLDQNVTVTADTSMEALGLQAVDLIAKTIISIVLKTDANAAIDKTAKVKELVNEILHQRDCVGALGDITNIGNFIKECFTTKIFQIAFDGKWWTTLLVPVMTAFSFISLGKGVVETIRDLGNGRAKYSVTASRPKPDPYKPFAANDWGRHLSRLIINRDGSGFHRISTGAGGAEGCGTGDNYCAFNANFKATPNSDGSLTATYTKVWYEFGDGQIVPLPSSFEDTMPKVGDSIQIKLFEGETVLTQQQGSLAQYDMDIELDDGRTFRGFVWCGPNSFGTPGQYCGA